MPPRSAKKALAKRTTTKKEEASTGPEKPPVDPAPVEENPQLPVPEEKPAIDEAPAAAEVAESAKEVEVENPEEGDEKMDDVEEEEEEDDDDDGDNEEEEEEEEEEENVVEDGNDDGGSEKEAGEGNHEDNIAADVVEKSEEHKTEGADIPEGEDGQDDGDGEESEDEENDDADKGDDASLYLHTPSEKSKKHKEVEIFVGGLTNKATEDDLIKTFSAFGEVQFARIARNPGSKKSKGFAFIQFANVEQAKKVLAELKDGVEVQGKRATVSASTANDTLYLGNICKTWTANQVRTTLKSLGVEHDFEMLLPNDPNNEGNNKGFAFLEFSNHFDAMAAFQLLKSPDAYFGRDKSAKVAFAHSMRHLSEESLSQVKTVYVEGLPSSWDEEKIKDLCKQYGEIERIELSRKFSRKKRKDFGFIAFASRESALACVEGINNGQVGEGESKISANLAKSEKKRPFTKPAGKGYAKSEGDNADVVDQSEKDNGVNEETASPNSGNTKSNKHLKSGDRVAGSKNVAQGNKKTPDSSGGKKRKGKKLDTNFGAQPQKRQRRDSGLGNARGRTSRYTRAPAGYHSSDLEPHAGLLPAGGRGNLTPRYDHRRHRSAFAGPTAEYRYPGYAHYPGYQAHPYAGGAQYPSRRAFY